VGHGTSGALLVRQWREEQWLPFVKDRFPAKYEPANRAMPVLKLDGLVFQIDVDAS
jgi:hypothetical protein